MGEAITPGVSGNSRGITTEEILAEFDQNIVAGSPPSTGGMPLGRSSVTTESILAEFETEEPAPIIPTPVARPVAPVAAPESTDIVIIQGSLRSEQSVYTNRGSCTIFGNGTTAYYYNPITLSRFANAISCETATLNNADKTSSAYASAAKFLGK